MARTRSSDKTTVTSSSSNEHLNENISAAPIIAISEFIDEKANNSPTDAQKKAYNRISKLREECNAWHNTLHKTADEMLYGVLQNCYTIYHEMCETTPEAKALRDALNSHLADHDIKITANKHTLTQILSCIFLGDRKRINTYSLVLQAALEIEVPVDGLVQYIIDNGGVDRIRRKKKNNGSTSINKADMARSVLKNHHLATLDDASVKQHLDAAKEGILHVAIITQRAGGSIDLNAIVSSESVLKAALTAYFNSNKGNIASANSLVATHNQQQEQNMLLEDLAQQIA